MLLPAKVEAIPQFKQPLTAKGFQEFVDIGDSGRHSDGGGLSNSDFGQALETDPLSIPSPKPLPGATDPDFHLFL